MENWEANGQNHCLTRTRSQSSNWCSDAPILDVLVEQGGYIQSPTTQSIIDLDDDANVFPVYDCDVHACDLRKRSRSMPVISKRVSNIGDEERVVLHCLSDSTTGLVVDKNASALEGPSPVLTSQITSSVCGNPASSPILKESKKKEVCFICFSKFSDKYPPAQIPCRAKCNSAPVHKKCMYEWIETKNSPTQQESTCPLCRGALGSVEYIPHDPLNTAAMCNFAHRKNFVMRPIPRSFGVARCYLKITRDYSSIFGGSVRYELYLQGPCKTRYPRGPLPTADVQCEDDKLLIVAEKRKGSVNLFSSTIDMSVDIYGRDFDRSGQNYIGCMKSSASGLEHSILAPCNAGTDMAGVGVARKSGGRKGSYTEIGAVRYSQNRFGKNVGPRRMKVVIPKVVREETKQANETPAETVHRNRTQNMTSSSTVSPANNNNTNGCCGVECGLKAAGLKCDFTEEPHEDWETEEFTRVESAEVDSDEEDFSDDEDCESGSSKWSTCIYRPPYTSQSMRAKLRKRGEEPLPDEKLVFGNNKQPYWLDSIQAYSLDFSGRVTLPSNKNFQLILQGEPERTPSQASRSFRQPIHHDITLQFGKVHEGANEVYTLDLQWPLSPVQAFGICLSACVHKLACA